MHFLVTGGAGYLGSVLVPKLLVRGHTVRVVDLGYFGLDHLRSMGSRVQVVRDDLGRGLEDDATRAELFDGVDAVIHLAAISNDPSADLNPELTERVNYLTTVRLATTCRDLGIRLVFSSTCSVYGQGEGLLDESAHQHPLTTYARTKSRAESALLDLADDGLPLVILRNGTLFGYSPRMRFDLVVNIFSLQVALYGSVQVFGPGTQWRPFLHVRDAARALIHFAEVDQHSHRVYNIAHENLRVLDLTRIFAGLAPGTQINHVAIDSVDDRDYQVSTQRMNAVGFETRIPVQAGAEEMLEALVSGAIRDPESAFYRNAKWLSQLSDISGKGHQGLAEMMETMARLRSRGGD